MGGASNTYSLRSSALSLCPNLVIFICPLYPIPNVCSSPRGWLAKALETAVEQGGEATQSFATSVRNVGGDNAGGHPDTVPDRAATERGFEHNIFQTKTAEAAGVVAPSLALVDSVLAMAPSHQAGLRCRASILTRLGHAPDALVAANRAVSAAETAVRASEGKLKDPGSGGASNLASEPAPTSMSLPAAASAEADLGASEKTRAAKNGGSTTVGGGGCCVGGGGQCSSNAKSIGFMRSSKVSVVLGGLLLTGGGRACTLDVAKSLVLRGCLRQKMGRRKQAEDDYRQALRICCNRRRETAGRLGSHRIELNINNHDDQTTPVGGDKPSASVRGRWRTLRKGCRGRAGGQSNVSEVECAAYDGKMGAVPDDAHRLCQDGVKTLACDQGAVETRGASNHQDERCELMKLESLIHHNLATLHLATILGTDNRVSFHKVRLTVAHHHFFTRTFSFRSAPRVKPVMISSLLHI